MHTLNKHIIAKEFGTYYNYFMMNMISKFYI